MVQIQIDLTEPENYKLNVLKAQLNFKRKSDLIKMIIREYKL